MKKTITLLTLLFLFVFCYGCEGKSIKLLIQLDDGEVTPEEVLDEYEAAGTVHEVDNSTGSSTVPTVIEADSGDTITIYVPAKEETMFVGVSEEPETDEETTDE